MDSARTLRLDGQDYQVETVQRFDRAVITNKPRVDEQTGFLHVQAKLTRAPAVFTYQAKTQDGSLQTRKEFRSAEAVFSRDNLERMANGVITLDHPPESVHANNVKQYQIGYGDGNIRIDGDHAVLGLVITDKDAIQNILSGKIREISCGYTCDVVFRSGVHKDSHGREERFDAEQLNHKNNHIALVERGRAGTARILMDSAEQVLDESQPFEVSMDKQDTNQQDKFTTLEQQLAQLKAQAEKERARADALEAARDALLSQTVKQEAKEDAAKQLGEAVRARMNLCKAVQMVGRFDSQAMERFDSLSDSDLKKVALDACGMSTAGKSEVYIDAAFDIKLNEAKSNQSAVQKVDQLGGLVAQAAQAQKQDIDDVLQKRCNDSMKSMDEAYKREVPGGFTRKGPTYHNDFSSSL